MNEEFKFNLKTVQVSYFENYKGIIPRKTLLKNVFKGIINGSFRTKVEACRNHVTNGQKKEADNIKINQIPTYTPCGTFKDKRGKENIETYNQIILLELNNIPSESYSLIINTLKNIPYTLFVCKNVCGDGLDILTLVSGNLDNHTDAIEQVSLFYEETLGYEVNRLNTEITKVCAISYDPDAYLNENPDSFNYSLIPEQNSIFDRNTNIAKFAETAKVAEEVVPVENQNNVAEVKDELSSLPFIPEDIYNNLPSLLKDSTIYFKDPREKDIFLTGAIGVLSGCFPTVSGQYSSEILYPNLFTFIVAPAASGKGALAHTKMFGIKYHKELLENSISSTKSVLFIPGNSSSAVLSSLLKEGDGNGIFFETEADTLGNTFKQDWGNFSDVLRKGFHHEPITAARKTKNEYIEIEKPKLSVVISSTPSQIQGIIKSAENGLFSRFIFYAFKSNAFWKDVTPNTDGTNLIKHIDSIAKKAYDITLFYNQFENINFCLTKAQWEILNKVQSESLENVKINHGEDASALIKRMGVMWFRITMILTALRNHNCLDETKTLICNDIDFNIAKSLMLTYKSHILYVYETLPKDQPIIKNDNINLLYANLPEDEFTRQYFIQKGILLGYKTRAVDGFLKELLDKGSIGKQRSGVYKKIVS